MSSLQWYFSGSREDDSTGAVIGWWEIRRIPYNIMLAFVGVTSMVLTFVFIVSSGILRRGEDAIEPIGWVGLPLLGGIFFNGCYTMGWLVEIALRRVLPLQAEQAGPRLLKLGVGLSIVIVSLPALGWGIYDMAHWASQ